jgi:hypothetical protein
MELTLVKPNLKFFFHICETFLSRVVHCNKLTCKLHSNNMCETQFLLCDVETNETMFHSGSNYNFKIALKDDECSVYHSRKYNN